MKLDTYLGLFHKFLPGNQERYTIAASDALTSIDASPPHALTVSRDCIPDIAQSESKRLDPPILTSGAREVASGAVIRRSVKLVAEEERPEISTLVVFRLSDPSKYSEL